MQKFSILQGRLNRQPYWLRVLALMVVTIAAALLIMFVGPAFGLSTYGLYLMIPIVAAVVFSSLSLAVRRLHDRNKSGWWLIPFYLIPNVLAGIGDQFGENPLAIVFLVASLALSIWALVEIGFLRGTVGDNEYGPDPLGGVPAAV
ncbi:MAG: DUF805 domain-containing protein [Methyloligellaceae bacterium]